MPPSDTITRPTRSLQGKVAIVTGAGALLGGIGNGRATAILLAEDGCFVICADLKRNLAEGTVRLIEQEGHGKAIAVEADVTKAEDCKHLIDIALSEYGRLDILVNNVGVTGPKGNSVDVDMQAFMSGLEINVASMIQMAKYAIPVMAQNEGQYAGAIVNMSSVAGLLGGTPNILYPTSKGAIVNMTRAMAANHAGQRIRVNCVCPGKRPFPMLFWNMLISLGMVYTPMMYGGKRMSENERAVRKSRSLLQTEGNGWDVASAIRFLASDQSRWMTGVVLPVDAGTTAATGIGLQGLHDSTSSN